MGRIVTVKYSIGYGSHETEMEFEEDATDEEIGLEVMAYVNERLEYSWERES